MGGRIISFFLSSFLDFSSVFSTIGGSLMNSQLVFMLRKEIMKNAGVFRSFIQFVMIVFPSIPSCIVLFHTQALLFTPNHSLSHITSNLPFSFPVNHSHIHSPLINHSIPLVCTSMYRCGSFPLITTKHPFRVFHHSTHTSHILH